jgi:hypothetical protein
MDPIPTLKPLREQAARKRDKAIQAARNEYRDTLKQIDQLGMRLSLDVRTFRGARRKQPIHELIVQHMPKDRPFALRDLLPILSKAEPSRQFREQTIRVLFKRLIDEELVCKVRKSDHGFMLWRAPECPIDELGPLATVSVADAMEYALKREGPLRPVELLIAIQKYGYRPDAAPRNLLATLGQALKRSLTKFGRLSAAKKRRESNTLMTLRLATAGRLLPSNVRQS